MSLLCHLVLGNSEGRINKIKPSSELVFNEDYFREIPNVPAKNIFKKACQTANFYF